ncbi:hypothetical protein NMY22_g11368 [Coprinellus aureogranulatus]|nr:hypothetical protein NMY22_g11368 [Coprinellus aureogranulatus]
MFGIRVFYACILFCYGKGAELNVFQQVGCELNVGDANIRGSTSSVDARESETHIAVLSTISPTLIPPNLHPDMARRSNSSAPRNPTGRNQHQKAKIIHTVNDIVDRIQRMFDRGVLQKNIPKHLAQEIPGFSISGRTIRRYIQDYNIRTPRHTGLSDVEIGVAILRVLQDDPLRRWGARKIKEKLGLQSIHVTRDFITDFLRKENPEAAAGRHPVTRKVHPHGLSSAGPNEEWGIDGHEKLLALMGIGVYGGTDKYSRLELGLWACPNPRDGDLPPALWLRMCKSAGGMPVTTTCDKGTELGKLIPLVTQLRAKYQPYLPEERIPAVTATKSIKNITRERSWRPLYEDELSNVAHEYRTGMGESGYHPNDEFHQVLARWVWAQIVQARLDDHMRSNAYHTVRKQVKILLPSGARRVDMYKTPEDFGGEDLKIPVPTEDIDRLLAQYDKPHLTQFGSDNEVTLFKDLHASIGSPKFVARNGWSIFKGMMSEYCDRF